MMSCVKSDGNQTSFKKKKKKSFSFFAPCCQGNKNSEVSGGVKASGLLSVLLVVLLQILAEEVHVISTRTDFLTLIFALHLADWTIT